MFQSDSEGIVEGLLTGAFDVGLIGAHIHGEALELTPFYEDRMVLITPVNDHFRALAARGVTIEDICREPILLREKGSGSKKCISSYLRQMGVEESRLNGDGAAQRSGVHQESGGRRAGRVHHLGKGGGGRTGRGAADDV